MTRSTEVTVATEPGAEVSTLTVHASDRPGLLADIGTLLNELEVRVQRARINTLGDRVEDIFEICNADGEPYSEAAAYALSQGLRQSLDYHLQQAL